LEQTPEIAAGTPTEAWRLSSENPSYPSSFLSSFQKSGGRMTALNHVQNRNKLQNILERMFDSFND
jgi:hypothetical protein